VQDIESRIAAAPKFDWERRHDPSYCREFARAFEAVVGFPPIMGGDDDDEPLSKEEADKLKAAIAKKDRELRDANKEHAKELGKVEAQVEELKAEVEAAAKKGDGKDGDDERIAKLEKRVEKAESKAEEADEKRVAAEQAATAIDVATRLRFRNPKRAIKQLDSDDLTDEDSIESALEKLATEEPYMVSTKKQRTVDDTKPKSKSKPKGKDGEEGKEKETGKDEPTGVNRIRKAYESSEEDAGDEGGDEGGSDD
jgi:hypothetical protein